MTPTAIATVSALGIGFTFGLRHALEADHLAAVSTIVAARRTLTEAALVGGLWGVGHAAALIGAAVVVIVLDLQIDRTAARWLDGAVAIMLVGLGLAALRRVAWRGAVHHHGEFAHDHPHQHEGRLSRRFSVRPVAVGVVHGLAGSAALMLVVLTTMPSVMARIAYVGAFGVGSICGMVAMSILIAAPIFLTGRRFLRAHVVVQTAAATFSLALGCAMAYRL